MNEANWHTAILWRGIEMLPRLRTLTPEERMRVMHEADEWSMREPLWLLPLTRKLAVPSWSDQPCSPAQVMALVVFGLWVHVGEESAPALLAGWPEIKIALQFVPNLDSGNAGTRMQESAL